MGSGCTRSKLFLLLDVLFGFPVFIHVLSDIVYFLRVCTIFNRGRLISKGYFRAIMANSCFIINHFASLTWKLFDFYKPVDL